MNRANAKRAAVDNAIRLFEPQPIHVLANSAGVPKMLGRERPDAKIMEIIDVWRIDDEWWREEICRRYFLLQLDDGRDASIFQDLTTGQWFEQRYS